MSDDADVLVVGAGLAGLRAAQILNNSGLRVILFDRDDHVGGRLASRTMSGFTLDRGFQLINPSYPELVATGVLKDFDLRRFRAVVRFTDGHTIHEIGDPRGDPRRLVSSLRHPDVSFNDAVKFAFMMSVLRLSSARAILKGPDFTLREALLRNRFSSHFIESVLAPFLRGPLLDNELMTSWHYSALVLKSFTRGLPGTHPQGIAALPRALEKSLSATQVQLGENVIRVASTSVQTEGNQYRARAVIVATDGSSARELVGVSDTAWRAQTTWWLSLPRQRAAAQLRIDTGRGFLSNLLDVSSVAPERAASGRSLVAANANGEFTSDTDDDVCSDVSRLYEVGKNEVELIDRDAISHALPDVVIPLDLQRPQVHRDVIVAGDYLQTPSIQGALVSGRRAAHITLRRLNP